MTTAEFTATAYGHQLTGTCDAFGWTPDERTASILKGFEPSKARRAALRCMRAASKAHEAACVR